MGLGDELIAAGQAERLWRETGRAVAILDKNSRPRRHELWAGNPAIDPDSPLTVRNGPGCRPYIRYPFTREGHLYTDWRVRDHRGTIHLTAGERAWAAAQPVALKVPDVGVVINPLIKDRANPNKDWGFARWQAVVDALPEVRFTQLGTGPLLDGVTQIATPSFRLACAVLERARLYAGHEGGMHHAAAALRAPAVVIFGGAVSVESMGYPEHVNLASGEPCGRWLPCDHCREAMARITVEQVVAAVRAALR